MREFDNQVRDTLRQRVLAIEAHLDGDVIFYYGPIFPSVQKRSRDFIEQLKADGGPRNRLVVFLNSPGGSAETVEKLVEIVRFHYQEVYFVVPDDILQTQDLAMLSRFEQAKSLTITLLKKWLVEYKFKDWTTHQTTPALVGQPVTQEQKAARAEEIATVLSDNKLWHSHGRMIGVATVKNVLRLKVEDYSRDVELRPKILAYSDFLTDYITRHDYKHFLHSRCYF